MLDVDGIDEWIDFVSATVINVPHSTYTRIHYHLGFYWLVAADGGVGRISPYGQKGIVPWCQLPGDSFAKTPSTIYPQTASRAEEPCLVVAGQKAICAVSLLRPGIVRTLYKPEKAALVHCNAKEDRYLAVASWSQGIAFIERTESSQSLVIQPFEGEPWRVPIEDSVVQIGPVARGDFIGVCTERQQYWYQISSRSLHALKFPAEFRPLIERPAAEVANIGPGILPLSVGTSEQEARTYVLGQIGGRLHYWECRLGETIASERPRIVPVGAFIDMASNGELLINASTELIVLAASGIQKHVCNGNLKISMPAGIRNKTIYGFREGSYTPVVCRKGLEMLPASVDGCDENTVMGWLVHAYGVSLAMRQNKGLKLLTWGKALIGARRTGAYAS